MMDATHHNGTDDILGCQPLQGRRSVEKITGTLTNAVCIDNEKGSEEWAQSMNLFLMICHCFEQCRYVVDTHTYLYYE